MSLTDEGSIHFTASVIGVNDCDRRRILSRNEVDGDEGNQEERHDEAVYFSEGGSRERGGVVDEDVERTVIW